jgi:hypothetical protein
MSPRAAAAIQLERARAELEAERGEPTPERPIKRKPSKQLEAQHAKALIEWRDRAQGRLPAVRWLHASLNGAHLTPKVAKLMKAEGMTAGVWDFLLPRHHGPRPIITFVGLYLELKIPGREKEKNGGLSDKQIEFGTEVHAQGYCCCLVYGWHQAREAIEAYLAGKPVPYQWHPSAV